jgi:hypothetical protein
MKLVKRIAVGLAALAMTLGVTIGTAPKASAATCAWYRACIWDLRNFAGSTLSIAMPGGTSAACITIAYNNFKNIASSFGNGSNKTIYWYDGDNCTGAYLLTLHGGNLISGVPSSVDNRANSFYIPPYF